MLKGTVLSNGSVRRGRPTCRNVSLFHETLAAVEVNTVKKNSDESDFS